METPDKSKIGIAIAATIALVQFLLQGVVQDPAGLGFSIQSAKQIALALGAFSVTLAALQPYFPSPQQHAENTELRARNERLAAIAPKRRVETVAMAKEPPPKEPASKSAKETSS